MGCSMTQKASGQISRILASEVLLKTDNLPLSLDIVTSLAIAPQQNVWLDVKSCLITLQFIFPFGHLYGFHMKQMGLCPLHFGQLPFGQLYRHQKERRGLRPLHFSLRSNVQYPNGTEGASPPTLFPLVNTLVHSSVDHIEKKLAILSKFY